MLLASLGCGAGASERAYLEELLQRARTLRLADRPEWHALLHYQPRLLGSGLRSLVDAQSFFNASSGKTDPQAELDATVSSFFALIDKPGDDRHPQCRFPARYAWLKQELGFVGERLTEQSCPGFQQWYSRLDPEALTLVFAASYLNNPASMFGHTLLRIDGRGQDEDTRLLADTANFAAHTEQARGLSYAVQGVFGSFPGRFSVAPYYYKVKEYGDIQNRDLWEYRLNFTPPEIERVLRHLWEFRSVYFDYYFFDENCSYQLLSLLEVTRPNLGLTRQFPGWVIPADTIRAVTAIPGLLGEVKYRPARATILKQRQGVMNGELPALAARLATDRIRPDAEALQRLPPDQQARVLELAVDYLAYQEASNKAPNAHAERLTLALLSARNRLDLPDQTPIVPIPKLRPDQGHRGVRAGFGYGFGEPRQFAQLDLRPAYHDLMDPEGGYTRGAQLQFFNVTLRWYPEDQDIELERLDAVDLVSLFPWSGLLKPVSWRINLGAAQRRFEDRTRSLVGHLEPGVGLSFDLGTDTQVYGFAEASIELSDRFDTALGMSLGPGFGVLHDLSDRWRIGLSARLRHSVAGDAQDRQEIILGQRISLSKQSAWRFDLSWTREFDRDYLGGTASLHLYF